MAQHRWATIINISLYPIDSAQGCSKDWWRYREHIAFMQTGWFLYRRARTTISSSTLLHTNAFLAVYRISYRMYYRVYRRNPGRPGKSCPAWWPSNSGSPDGRLKPVVLWLDVVFLLRRFSWAEYDDRVGGVGLGRCAMGVGRYVGWECEGVDQRTDGAGEHFDGWESVLIVDDIFGVFLRRPGDRHSQRDLSRHKYYLKLVVKRKFASFWTGLSPFGAWAYERMPGATGYWPTTMVDARPGPPSRPQWGDNVKPHPLIYRPVQQ